MLGLIKTILIIGVIYYGVKLLVRYLLPYLLKIFINKQRDKFNSNFSSQAGTPETDFTTNKKVKSESKEKLGDYVDYEEIKD